jgi:hypothetical protein
MRSLRYAPRHLIAEELVSGPSGSSGKKTGPEAESPRQQSLVFNLPSLAYHVFVADSQELL